MLGAFDIKYLPCIAIKGQVLADVVAEFTEGVEEARAKKAKIPSVEFSLISNPHPPPSPKLWELYADRVSNQNESGIGIILVSPEKITMGKSCTSAYILDCICSISI